MDGVHVRSELRLCTADAKVIVGDAEILRVTINGSGHRWGVRGRFSRGWIVLRFRNMKSLNFYVVG